MKRRRHVRTQINRTAHIVAVLLLCGAALAAVLGCHSAMYDQPRYEAGEPSDFFDDGRASRPVVAGTIARGQLPEDEGFATGKSDGELLRTLPKQVELNAELLERGQERFNIYCSNCHGRLGDGDGMIVRRGYRRPPTYHSDRLRGVPLGHFYDVMSNGFGAMPAYNLQIPTRDRWAIAAYVRSLQLSQYATIDDLPVAERSKLERERK